MSPDRYNGNPNDPNYVQDPDRRKLLRRGWQALGVMATLAGAYEFVTQVLPAIGRAVGGIHVDLPSGGSENSSESSGPEWCRQSIVSDDISGDALLQIDAPPGTILWLEVPYPPDKSGTKIYLIIAQNDNNNYTNWGENILALSSGPVHRELYKPTVMVSDAWHMLFTFKKEYLSQKYGLNAQVELNVDSPGNTIDINEYIKISDIS